MAALLIVGRPSIFVPIKLKRSPKDHPATAHWYQLYTRSERWKNIKEKKFKQVGRKCERCQGTERINVHHLTYEHVTSERLRELQVLCGTCHDKTPHDRYHVPYIDRIYDNSYINLNKVTWSKVIEFQDEFIRND